MDHDQIARHFFHPVCTEAEIDRIFNVSNAADHLLRLRAETIVDHMRLYRVYRNKALADPDNWSLEKSFQTSHYDRFIEAASEETAQRCSRLTYGNVFSNDPNGTIFATDYGPMVTISEALTFFLKFANLALLQFDTEVPPQVRFNALRIAIRVMLKTEAMDFLMDPRGIVPESIGIAIHDPIPLQLEFIAGHEFSHHVLGHLNPVNVFQKPVFFAISPKDQDYKPLPVFSQSQQEEFDADRNAILLIGKDRKHQFEVVDAALLWFGCLQLYEAVADFMCPFSPWVPGTHPTARQRFEALVDISRSLGRDDNRLSNQFSDTINRLKDMLLDDVSTQIEMYEFYGSVYLDKPDTEWRGPELIDRKDYY
jgi:hypothetical protein